MDLVLRVKSIEILSGNGKDQTVEKKSMGVVTGKSIAQCGER